MGSARRPEWKPVRRLLIPLHELIRGNVHKLYGGMTISAMTLVRITRDAEVERGSFGAELCRAGPGTSPATTI